MKTNENRRDTEKYQGVGLCEEPMREVRNTSTRSVLTTKACLQEADFGSCMACTNVAVTWAGSSSSSLRPQ